MSAFRKSGSEQPATKIVKKMFDCLQGLADLNSTLRSSADCKRTFSPDVEMMVALGDMIKDWEIEAKDLEGRNGYYAELLTDKKSLSQFVVLYTRRNNKKGLFPVLYLRVPFGEQASAVLEEALSRLGADHPANQDAA